MTTPIECLRSRRIGSHQITLGRYRDEENDLEFHGVTAGCVIQHKGTLAECEGYWRQLVKSLNKADAANAKRKGVAA